MAKTRPKDSARTKTAKAKSRKVARWRKEFDGLLEECGVLAKKGGHFDESTGKVVLRLVRGVSKTMDITWKEDNSGPSLGPVYVEVAGLLGSDAAAIKIMVSSFITNEGIVVEDTSGRGRGSENADKDAMRKRTSEQYHAIEAFVDYCNSKKGGGKCTIDQIQMYMQDGPRVGSEDPPLPAEHRVLIPRSSLSSYLLRKHLQYEFQYVNGKTRFNINNKKRHTRIRKFAIEISRALKLQATGRWVIVFTDETYIHQVGAFLSITGPCSTWTLLLHGPPRVTPPPHRCPDKEPPTADHLDERHEEAREAGKHRQAPCRSPCDDDR